MLFACSKVCGNVSNQDKLLLTADRFETTRKRSNPMATKGMDDLGIIRVQIHQKETNLWPKMAIQILLAWVSIINFPSYRMPWPLVSSQIWNGIGSNSEKRFNSSLLSIGNYEEARRQQQWNNATSVLVQREF